MNSFKKSYLARYIYYLSSSYYLNAPEIIFSADDLFFISYLFTSGAASKSEF